MFFSVITPTYNRSKDLYNAYNSLKEQTYTDFEWIIVDDGSTDNTKETVNQFISENLIKINYIQQKHGGKHIAMRKAYESAKGSWFFSLDSDDTMYDSNTLKNVKHAIDSVSSNYDWVAGCFVDQKNQQFPAINTEYIDFDKDKFLNCFTSDKAYLLNICSCMRASFVKSVLPPQIIDNLSFFPECVIALRLIMNNPNIKIRLYNQKWYKYNTGRDDSVSINIANTNAQWWQAKSLCEDFYKFELYKKYPRFYKTQMNNTLKYLPSNKSIKDNYKVFQYIHKRHIFFKFYISKLIKIIFSINHKGKRLHIKIFGINIHI